MDKVVREKMEAVLGRPMTDIEVEYIDHLKKSEPGKLQLELIYTGQSFERTEDGIWALIPKKS